MRTGREEIAVKAKAGCIARKYCRCEFAVSFGLGLVLATFCPTRLTLFFAGVILVALGVAVAKH